MKICMPSSSFLKNGITPKKPGLNTEKLPARRSEPTSPGVTAEQPEFLYHRE
jgi:hypothetical protein